MNDMKTLAMTAKTSGEAAAVWWVSMLTKSMSAQTSSDRESRSQVERLAAFGNILARMVDEMLERKFYDVYGVDISTDHDHVLSAAAAEAGLILNAAVVWPRWTSMIVNSEQVIVRRGYGAQPEVIWSRTS